MSKNKILRKNILFSIVSAIIFFIFLFFICFCRYLICYTDTYTDNDLKLISVSSENSVSQNIQASNIWSIRIFFLPKFINADSRKFCVVCEDEHNRFEKEVYLSAYSNDIWSEIKLSEFVLLSMESPTITIYNENLNRENDVYLAIYHGLDNAGLNVRYHDIKKEGEILSYECMYFNFANLMLLTTYLLLITAILNFGIICLRKKEKKCMTTQAIIILLAISWLKLDIFNISLSEWSTVKYLVSYRYGISAQALIGSAVRLVVPYITENTIKVIATFFMITAAIVLIKIFGVNREQGKDYVILALSFILSPFFITRYFNAATYAMFDSITIALIGICLLLIFQGKRVEWVIICSAFGTLSYQEFVFCGIPIILLYLAYRFFENDKERKYGITFAGTFCLNIVISLLTQFCGVRKDATVINVTELISQNTSVAVDSYTIQMQYFTSIKDIFRYVASVVWSCGEIYIFPLTVLLVSPVMMYWWKIWLKFIKMHQSVIFKYITVLIPLAIIAPIITFFIQCDWARYFCVYFYSFVLLLILMYNNDKSSYMKNAVEQTHNELEMKLGKYWYAVLLVQRCGINGEYSA